MQVQSLLRVVAAWGSRVGHICFIRIGRMVTAGLVLDLLGIVLIVGVVWAVASLV